MRRDRCCIRHLIKLMTNPYQLDSKSLHFVRQLIRAAINSVVFYNHIMLPVV